MLRNYRVSSILSALGSSSFCFCGCLERCSLRTRRAQGPVDKLTGSRRSIGCTQVSFLHQLDVTATTSDNTRPNESKKTFDGGATAIRYSHNITAMAARHSVERRAAAAGSKHHETSGGGDHNRGRSAQRCGVFLGLARLLWKPASPSGTSLRLQSSRLIGLGFELHRRVCGRRSGHDSRGSISSTISVGVVFRARSGHHIWQE